MCVDVLMDNVYRNACRHVCRHETASQTRAHICSVVGTEGLLAFAILERCADAYVDMRIHMCIHVCIDMCADRVGRLWTHAQTYSMERRWQPTQIFNGRKDGCVFMQLSTDSSTKAELCLFVPVVFQSLVHSVFI